MNYTNNSNVTVALTNTFQGLPLYKQNYFVVDYLDKIYQVFNRALKNHKRIYLVRCDLHFPTYNKWGELYTQNLNEISKFFDSLNAKIAQYQKKRTKQGKRVHDCSLRYVWAKEQNIGEHPHYHVALLLNNEVFNNLGYFNCYHDFKKQSDINKSLAEMIVEAWCSAVGCEPRVEHKLVHFPKNKHGKYDCTYRIRQVEEVFEQEFSSAFSRVSYLAKAQTKRYGDGSKWFQISRY